MMHIKYATRNFFGASKWIAFAWPTKRLCWDICFRVSLVPKVYNSNKVPILSHKRLKNGQFFCYNFKVVQIFKSCSLWVCICATSCWDSTVDEFFTFTSTEKCLENGSVFLNSYGWVNFNWCFQNFIAEDPLRSPTYSGHFGADRVKTAVLQRVR